jgi:hypothetical protein
MNEPELREAVEGPARDARLAWEHGLVDLITRELAARRSAQAGNLPLLSHALRATWLAGDRRTLAFADYHQAGGIDGAIAGTAESSYADLPPDARDAARRVLLRLVRVPRDGEATRRRVDRDELPRTPAAEAAVEGLSRARLVSIDGDAVEVVHESLLTEWPRLRGWIAENQTWLRTRDQLADDAASWHQDGRDPSRLHRGTRLTVARDQLAAAPDADLDPLAAAFLAASVRAHEEERARDRRAARRLRVFAGVLAFLLAVAGTATAVAVRQRQVAIDQQTLAAVRGLHAQAEQLRGSNIGLALKLDLAADAIRSDTGTLSHLAATLAASPLLTSVDDDQYVTAVAFSPDGRTLATTTTGVGGGVGGRLRLWDVKWTSALSGRIRQWSCRRPAAACPRRNGRRPCRASNSNHPARSRNPACRSVLLKRCAERRGRCPGATRRAHPAASDSEPSRPTHFGFRGRETGPRPRTAPTPDSSASTRH